MPDGESMKIPSLHLRLGVVTAPLFFPDLHPGNRTTDKMKNGRDTFNEEADRHATVVVLANRDTQRIKAGEPRGFELESADAVYRCRNGKNEDKLRENSQRLTPPMVREFLWSLGD